jgi:hypothetical protein
MKNLILVLMFSLVSFYTYSQSNKTLVKSFPNVVENVFVDVNCTKTINRWTNDFVKIELNISGNFSEELLSSLVKIGRYDLSYKNENNTTIITLPNIYREIIIRGEKVSEVLNMVIWMPETQTIDTKTILQ